MLKETKALDVMRRKANFSGGNPLYATKRPVIEAREYVNGVPSLDLTHRANCLITLGNRLAKLIILMYR